MHSTDIYSYITQEQSAFQTLKSTVVEGWDFNFYEHIKNTVIYKFGQYLSGKSDDKPNKNIILPLLRLRYRTEGFDVKDIELFVEDSKNHWKSFFVKKFHEYWARKNEIDVFIDKESETDIDFGGVLVKDTGEIKPEVVPWQRVAFCDTTDLLSGPICERHQYSPDQLMEMSKKGWKKIDEIITLSQNYKVIDKKTGRQTKTPSKYIEIYELHGVLPAEWLYDDDYEYKNEKEEKYVRQFHICGFYQTTDGNKQGITLFKGKESESPYKFRTDEIYNRAIGYGGVEELIEPQVWVNYGIIREKGLLDQVSKILYQTADVAFANKNKTSNLDNGEILIHEPNSPLTQINTYAPNMALFERAVVNWEAHARQTSAATESIMGETPSAGTPFKLQELITQTSLGLHDYRMGKNAVFIEGIYRDWIIPKIVKELNAGQEWLSELSADEMKWVLDRLVENETNNMVKELVLNGQIPTRELIEAHKIHAREQFLKGGNKKFLEVFKNEFKNAPINIRINVKGKQKDLVSMVDKMTNVFRTIMANPQGFIQMMQIPAVAKTFSEIIEFSGLSPVDFASFTTPQQFLQSQSVTQTIPSQQLVTNTVK